MHTFVQSDPIESQNKSTEDVHQPSKTSGISADDFYIDYDSEDDSDDGEDPF